MNTTIKEGVEMTTELSPAIVEALSIGQLPDVRWKSHDDLCDCVYQRIGMWTNPYLGETLEVRMCCIWGELYKQYPQFVRLVPAFLDYGHNDEWITEPAEWNGEDEMPKALWYRQLARKQGRSVESIRAEYSEKDELRPKGQKIPEPVPFILLIDGQEFSIDLRKIRFR